MAIVELVGWVGGGIVGCAVIGALYLADWAVGTREPVMQPVPVRVQAPRR